MRRELDMAWRNPRADSCSPEKGRIGPPNRRRAISAAVETFCSQPSNLLSVKVSALGSWLAQKSLSAAIALPVLAWYLTTGEAHFRKRHQIRTVVHEPCQFY